jgi:hypothetical protein
MRLGPSDQDKLLLAVAGMIARPPRPQPISGVVGADVEAMLTTAEDRRGPLPVHAISLRAGTAARVADWVRDQVTAFRSHGHLHSSAEGLPAHHHHHPH